MSRAVRLRFIAPQLPSVTEHPPEGANWIYEVKHDGYRTMLVIERGNAVAYTRNGHDWSDGYPSIIAAARKLPCRSAILDGEIIVQDARGVSDFEALQAALRSQPTRLPSTLSTFCTSTAWTYWTLPLSNAEQNCWNWLGTTRKVQFNSAKSSLGMLPPFSVHVHHMS
jgi:bifunctional non-homologous end joining protein LigD